MPRGSFTTVVENFLLSVQSGIGDTFLPILCFQNRRARGKDVYDSAFCRKSFVRAAMLCTAAFLVYMIYLSATTERFTHCLWCSLFFPSPGIFWIDGVQILLYGLVILWMLLQKTGWNVMLSAYPRPRPSMLPWAVFMFLVYSLGNGGLGLILSARQDVGYCFMTSSVFLYTILYAPVLFLVLRRDTQYLWNESRRQHGEESAALLVQSYGANMDVLDGLLTDESINRIASSDLLLQQRIGVGGCGEVWRAQWQGVDVAVKKLFAFSRKQERRALEDFAKECRTMSKLRHPHVLILLGISLDCNDRQPSMVFEFMAGGNLFDKLHPSGSGPTVLLERLWKLRLMKQCASAVSYLHTCNIIHRDLKPHNLLLDAAGDNLCVADFGLSRIISSNTMTATGTANWCAPEVLRRGRYTVSADVYSFGVVVLETFSEIVPFGGKEPAAISTAVVMKGKRPKIPASLDPEIVEFVQDCMCDLPVKRPTFVTLVERLDRMLAGCARR